MARSFRNIFSIKGVVMIGMICFLVTTFMGCSNENTKTINNTNTNNGTITDEGSDGNMNLEDNQVESMSLEEMFSSVKLPKQYLITYEVETKAGVLEYITKAKDSCGRFYHKADGYELLFVPVSNGYKLYKSDSGENFTMRDEGIYMEKYIDDTTKEFMDYAKKSNLQYSGVAKYVDTKKISGRDCKDYKIQMKLGILSQEYSFSIDKETGICTEWKEITNIGGHSSTEGNNYRCIQFQTDNITLPHLNN